MKPSKIRVAYIAHAFPALPEHYFSHEVKTLRARNVDVFIYAVFKEKTLVDPNGMKFVDETVFLEDFNIDKVFKAAWHCLRDWKKLKDIYARILFHGKEGPKRRVKALLHTWMGVYLSLLLKDQKISHIHAHHGYLAAWLAMIAARMLGITFSITLHGSDLLVDRVYLDLKIDNALFCFTISIYNKKFLLQKFPSTDPRKIMVTYMGVHTEPKETIGSYRQEPDGKFTILTVGILRPVKNHEFLLRACAELKRRRYRFLCIIIGEGKGRKRLSRLIRELDLLGEVKLLGFLDRQFVNKFYKMADVFVLTSKSEGIPIVLMEAMANEKPVIAPEITGIPELVRDGETGFLYQQGNLEDFVKKMVFVFEKFDSLSEIGKRARTQVCTNFDQQKNMEAFADIFIGRLRSQILNDEKEQDIR